MWKTEYKVNKVRKMHSRSGGRARVAVSSEGQAFSVQDCVERLGEVRCPSASGAGAEIKI